MRFFLHLREQIEKLAKIVFQSSSFAKKQVFAYAVDKRISSYPKLQDLFFKADKVALDNPWKFADLCMDISDEVKKRVFEIKRLRKEFTEKTAPQKLQGWIDNHGR
jgi:hypothetical protein